MAASESPPLLGADGSLTRLCLARFYDLNLGGKLSCLTHSFFMLLLYSDSRKTENCSEEFR